MVKTGRGKDLERSRKFRSRSSQGQRSGSWWRKAGREKGGEGGEAGVCQSGKSRGGGKVGIPLKLHTKQGIVEATLQLSLKRVQ